MSKSKVPLHKFIEMEGDASIFLTLLRRINILRTKSTEGEVMKSKKIDYKCPGCHATFKLMLPKCPTCGKTLHGGPKPPAIKITKGKSK